MAEERWCILCDEAELAVECARIADDLHLGVAPEVHRRPLDMALERTGPLALALSQVPEPEALAALARTAHEGHGPRPLLLLGDATGPEALCHLARDLGLPAVSQVRALLSTLAILRSGARAPWAASTRSLSLAERVRVDAALKPGERSPAVLTREDGGRLGMRPTRRGKTTLVGEPRDVADALFALAKARLGPPPPIPRVEDVEPRAVRDVILGPSRALSDPASKAALEPYDLPLPLEELCASPSRAAAEATRIGFPVRVALASPDLRVWDHPDLVADGVDSAARVRDVFRQMMALGAAGRPGARLLGVTVSAASPARALLRIRVRPVAETLVLTEIGFADPHGLASADRTQTVLPATRADLEQVLARLRGSPLFLEGSAGERRETVSAISDVLLRLAAFVHDFRREVRSVELAPLALLVGGGVEAREACVTVGDAFERSLEAPASRHG